MDADVPIGWLKDHVLRLNYLTGCAADTQRAAIAATPHLTALVGASFFVPFGTVMIAIAGRLHACASTVETVLCGVRSAMLTLMARNVWRMQRRGAISAATSMVVWQQLRDLHLASAHPSDDCSADTRDGTGKGSRGTPCLHCGTLNHVARKKCKTCGATTMAGAKEKPTVIKKNTMEAHLQRFGFSASADYATGIVSL